MAKGGNPVVITVDGPVAAGKGTLARRLAEHFGLRHLDSGVLYRATAARVLREGGDPTVAAVVETAARALTDADVSGPEIRDEAVGQAASIVAAMQVVRQALLAYQRAFAARPPGAVVEGRDIGTVVCADAPYKLFLTASVAARAERRYRELRARGAEVTLERVEKELIERDERDRGRAVAPLKPAKDAFPLDTTDLDAEAVFRAALDYIDARGWPQPRRG